MIDCSRNAVLKVEEVKKWIDLTSDLGYNCLQLYTEDTYEVNNEPYFGYMRGRYSKAELKEMDSYAKSKNMELIPCIQTLAHLNCIFRWPAYKRICDLEDVLLAEEERTYELIDNMFSTLAECFTTRRVNAGMDEAYFMFRGKYQTKNGYHDRTEVFIKHITRVAQIAAKYGFTMCIWSDMFFRIVAGNRYYATDANLNLDIISQIPSNVELCYWDYDTDSKETYETMFRIHEKIKPGVWWAGAVTAHRGFAPHNRYSIPRNALGFKACENCNIENVLITIWGNDGTECSLYSTLPGVFAASENAKGNFDMDSIKEKFFSKFGIPYDDFLLLDLPGSMNDGLDLKSNSEKTLLYNDCFKCILDSTLKGNEAKVYLDLSEKLAKYQDNATYGYLFRKMSLLCNVLSVKAGLGTRTRKAYEAKDKQASLKVLEDYRKLIPMIRDFYEVHRETWMQEKKPHGFDVQDCRLGGLMLRIEDCSRQFEKFCNDTSIIIPELEEDLLDYRGNGKDFSHEPEYLMSWALSFTPNVVSHKLVQIGISD